MDYKYKKLDKPAEFDVYFPDDDHIVYIRKASYDDIELYYVIMEDAYRTPRADIMTAKEVKDLLGIDLENQLKE